MRKENGFLVFSPEEREKANDYLENLPNDKKLKTYIDYIKNIFGLNGKIDGDYSYLFYALKNNANIDDFEMLYDIGIEFDGKELIQPFSDYILENIPQDRELIELGCGPIP